MTALTAGDVITLVDIERFRNANWKDRCMNKLQTARPIKRTKSGQLPRNYVAGGDTMRRSPMTVSCVAEGEPDRRKTKKDRRK